MGREKKGKVRKLWTPDDVVYVLKQLARRRKQMSNTDESKEPMSFTSTSNAVARRVPPSTIERWFRKGYATKEQIPRPGPAGTLTDAEETVLVDWILFCAELRMPVTRADIARQIHGFCGRQVSNTWFRNFFARHPILSLRTPQPLEASRQKAASEASIRKWFTDVYTVALAKKKYSTIFNMDETGVSKDPKQGKQRVVARRGARAVLRQSIGNSEHITVVEAISNKGTCAPPMFIVKGKASVNAETVAKSGLPGSWMIAVTESAWIDGPTFNRWLRAFVRHLTPADKPTLVVMDNHSTHVDPVTLKWAAEQDVDLLFLPAHTSHVLQPLDVGVFGPFKRAYGEAICEITRTEAVSTLTRAQLMRALKTAHDKAVTPANIAAGFMATGLWPLDIDRALGTKYIKGAERFPGQRAPSGKHVVDPLLQCS